MTTDFNSTTSTTGANRDRHRDGRVPTQRRESTETKAAPKTTEFMVYLVAVAGVLIASAVVGDNGAPTDAFRAERAWFFVVLLTVGYMISRGLAKAGSREFYDRYDR